MKELVLTSSLGWQTVVISGMATSIVTRVVNRAIVGQNLCGSEDWLNTSFGYAASAFEMSGLLRPRSWWIRPFIYWTSAPRRNLKLVVDKAHTLLIPEIDKRREEQSKHLDMLQWMVESATEHEKSYKVLVEKTLFLVLASVFSSVMGVSHAIMDLGAHPEFIEPLQQEIFQVVKEHGWSMQAVNMMHKLDSLLRESQRLNHPGLCRFAPSDSCIT